MSEKNPYFFLKQVIGDYIDCDLTDEEMNSADFLRFAAEEAVKRSKTSLIKYLEHKFEPQGYTLLMVLADSSLILHSWPEEKFISAEIFTCTSHSDPEDGLKYLNDVFKSREFKIIQVKR